MRESRGDSLIKTKVKPARVNTCQSRKDLTGEKSDETPKMIKKVSN